MPTKGRIDAFEATALTGFAASVAAFGVLSSVFGVALGWLLLGEDVGTEILLALGLVVAGLIVIKRPARG